MTVSRVVLCGLSSGILPRVGAHGSLLQEIGRVCIIPTTFCNGAVHRRVTAVSTTSDTVGEAALRFWRGAVAVVINKGSLYSPWPSCDNALTRERVGGIGEEPLEEESALLL